MCYPAVSDRHSVHIYTNAYFEMVSIHTSIIVNYPQWVNKCLLKEKKSFVNKNISTLRLLVSRYHDKLQISAVKSNISDQSSKVKYIRSVQ